MLLMLPLLIVIGASIFRMLLQGEPDAAGIMLSVLLGLVLIFVGLVFTLVHKFTVDMVVAIMYLRGSTRSAGVA